MLAGPFRVPIVIRSRIVFAARHDSCRIGDCALSTTIYVEYVLNTTTVVFSLTSRPCVYYGPRTVQYLRIQLYLLSPLILEYTLRM